jgi:hypothetical protein
MIIRKVSLKRGKSGGFWLLLIAWGCVLGATAVTWAAEFSAEAEVERYGQPQTIKVYVKGSWIRQELTDPFGQKQVFVSTGSEKGKTFVLYPATKSYMLAPAAAALSPLGADEGLEKIGTRRLLGQEWLQGYLCNKYEITFHNRYRGRLIQWIAVKLDYMIRFEPVDAPPGTPRRELRNIREEPVAESLFTLPVDYREVKKPVQGFCGAGVCTLEFY